MQTLQDVVMTGVGLILPNCSDRTEFWRQLSCGESQLRIEVDPDDGVPCPMGRIRDFDCSVFLDQVPPPLYEHCQREQQFYLSSLAQAYRDSNLQLGDIDPYRVGLFDGSSRGTFAFWYERMKSIPPGERVAFSSRDLKQGMPGQTVGIAAALFHIKGPTYAFSGTCASGAIAIGHAFREVQAGRLDVAFGTGHDSALVAPLLQMYRNAKLMSEEAIDATRAVRPYGGNSNNAFGEGAVTVVLETAAHAFTRKACVLAHIKSYQYGNGGQHPTKVDVTGVRPAELIAAALKEAGLSPQNVDFVIGHGNGVAMSDASELEYMRHVFGQRATGIPLLSTKPIYGHTLGASSALNVASAALMLKHDYLIPAVNSPESDLANDFNHQTKRGENRVLNTGMTVAFGMGGHNAILLLTKS